MELLRHSRDASASLLPFERTRVPMSRYDLSGSSPCNSGDGRPLGSTGTTDPQSGVIHQNFGGTLREVPPG